MFSICEGKQVYKGVALKELCVSRRATIYGAHGARERRDETARSSSALAPGRAADCTCADSARAPCRARTPGTAQTPRRQRRLLRCTSHSSVVSLPPWSARRHDARRSASDPQSPKRDYQSTVPSGTHREYRRFKSHRSRSCVFAVTPRSLTSSVVDLGRWLASTAQSQWRALSSACLPAGTALHLFSHSSMTSSVMSHNGATARSAVLALWQSTRARITAHKHERPNRILMLQCDCLLPAPRCTRANGSA